MKPPKNPLAIIENVFWEVGRLFILYFITIFYLFFKPMKVINWAKNGNTGEKIDYCPPATYFVLTLAFMIAISKFIFFQEAFDLLKASQIFTNVFMKGKNILNIIIAFGVTAIIFPINAVIVLCLTARRPTFDRVSTVTKFLIYYWATFFFLLMVLYIVFNYFEIGHPFSDISLASSGLLAIGLTVIFGFSLKELVNRPLWLCIVVFALTQAVAPVVIGGGLSHSKHVHNWQMDQKYEAADIVGIIKVIKKVDLDKPESFGSYAIQSVLSVEWQDTWKEKYRLDNKKFPSQLVSITTLMQGRSLGINEGEQYLVFLQLYKDTLIPLNGSPTAVYGIAENRTLIPLGHADFITERRIVEVDRIPVDSARAKFFK